MDACNAVERELDKVLYKFGNIKGHAERVLSEQITTFEELRDEFGSSEPFPSYELSAAQVVLLKQTLSKSREVIQRLSADHRDLHSTVSKVGKAIDRNFISDFASTSKEDVFAIAEKSRILNQVICQHFYRQGMLEIAEELAKEAGLEIDGGGKEPFSELNKIVDSFKGHDLGPALTWAEEHREMLEAQNSSLEFKLHRLRFIDLIQKGIEGQSEALDYARRHFQQFVDRHEKEIQTLMGMFLFLPHGIDRSPYVYLLDPNLWVEISDVFTRDACSLLGLSVDSPLSVCINAGCTALPALLNIKQVMQQRQVAGIWNGKDELPIEIDLGRDNRYHSMFACPILRQQSTENNPPMRLVCGHVISRDALNKLSTSNKLKCPYCPVEQSPADARLIYF